MPVTRSRSDFVEESLDEKATARITISEEMDNIELLLKEMPRTHIEKDAYINKLKECIISCHKREASEKKRLNASLKLAEKKLIDSDRLMKANEVELRQVVFERQKLTSTLEGCKEYLMTTSPKLKDLSLQVQQLQSTCSTQCTQIKRLQEQLCIAKENHHVSDMPQQHVSSLEQLIASQEQDISYLQGEIVEGEKIRKKLHDEILELKGNIRVFCRVRPSLSSDDAQPETSISYPTSMDLSGRGIHFHHNGTNHSFTFDKVFGPASTQEHVYAEISQLVQSALDGNKVCIFAYGQTGSGKTYTMMGKPNQPLEKGLIPRTLEQVFEAKDRHKALGWKYDIQVSMLEIYNETIRDLFKSAGEKSYIRHDENGKISSGIIKKDVCSIQDALDEFNLAAEKRSVAKTQMNEESSKSHLVVTLTINKSVNESTGQQVQGVLNLIDLAGSESLNTDGTSTSESGVGALKKQKETSAINTSLFELKSVLLLLAKKKNSYVTYRNSKLTLLLKHCLGGRSKTLMFVNVSPELTSAKESLRSLEFARLVNTAKVDKTND